MNLFDALATSIAAAEYPAILAAAMPAEPGPPRAPGSVKPVLQFSLFPITLDPSHYKNARSDSNPSGDLRSLFAFRQLVDPIPSFSAYYTPSGSSTETTYGGIVEGATADVSPFMLTMMDEARRQFHQTTFAAMDGTPGSWRPVYAVPEDWHDTSPQGRYRDLDIDVTGQGGPDSRFATIGADQALHLSVGAEPDRGSPLDPRTTISGVHLRYLFVQFRRPWLNPQLFESGGWYLSRQPEGYCSSGRLDDNHGALPLLPTGMLVAREVSVDAQWSAHDRAVLDAAASSGKPAFLGPLPLSAGTSPSNLQIIGWVSSLLPFSPKASDLSPGSIVVTNKGVFTARFSVAWQQGREFVNRESGSMLALAARSISIPADARNVSIKVEVMTAPWPAETWRTVATYQCATPVKRCYEVSGVTWAPVIKEMACPE